MIMIDCIKKNSVVTFANKGFTVMLVLFEIDVVKLTIRFGHKENHPRLSSVC